MAILKFSSNGTSLSSITLVPTDVGQDLTFVLPGQAAKLVAKDEFATALVQETTSLYSTNARLRSAISVTGAAQYSSTTGVINVDSVGSVVRSVNGATGVVNVTFGVSTEPVYLHAQNVTGDYAISANNNAFSTGPITVLTGAAVTVPTASVWVIN